MYKMCRKRTKLRDSDSSRGAVSTKLARTVSSFNILYNYDRFGLHRIYSSNKVIYRDLYTAIIYSDYIQVARMITRTYVTRDAMVAWSACTLLRSQVAGRLSPSRFAYAWCAC